MPPPTILSAYPRKTTLCRIDLFYAPIKPSKLFSQPIEACSSAPIVMDYSLKIRPPN
ncbi:hypothetical protein THIOM_004570 [Candidatus Thiomargarita nelsonii]|uniref:Uncharacterized protein n=1 Tax=Candidatus Thiomargarita nelsonii TaxID=1003181 RepID=A0A176RVH4_9GAMM|nr:hypothetical protein THIOM_004570 [Candidatus Thiomargarita nelsonii]